MNNVHFIMHTVILKKMLIFIVLILLCVGFFIFTSEDSKLNEQLISKLYKKNDEIPKNENIAYSIIGITAPQDVNNIHKYGQSLIEEALRNSEEIIDNKVPNITPFDNELKIRNNSEKDICWWELDRIIGDDNESCMSEREKHILLIDNNILLSRYMSLHKYARIRVNVPLSRNDNLIIPLHNIFLAYINKLSVLNNSVLVQELLLNDIRLWRSLASEKVSWIDKLIFLNVLLDDLKMLKVLLGNDKNHINNYEELRAVIEPLGVSNWAIGDSYILELKLSELRFCLDEGFDYPSAESCLDKIESMFFKKNMTVNKIYDHIDELLMLSMSTPEKISQSCAEASEKKRMSIMGWLNQYLFNYKGHQLYKHYTDYSSKTNLCNILKLINLTDNYFVEINEQLLGRSNKVAKGDGSI